MRQRVPGLGRARRVAGRRSASATASTRSSTTSAARVGAGQQLGPLRTAGRREQVRVVAAVDRRVDTARPRRPASPSVLQAGDRPSGCARGQPGRRTPRLAAAPRRRPGRAGASSIRPGAPQALRPAAPRCAAGGCGSTRSPVARLGPVQRGQRLVGPADVSSGAWPAATSAPRPADPGRRAAPAGSSAASTSIGRPSSPRPVSHSSTPDPGPRALPAHRRRRPSAKSARGRAPARSPPRPGRRRSAQLDPGASARRARCRAVSSADRRTARRSAPATAAGIARSVGGRQLLGQVEQLVRRRPSPAAPPARATAGPTVDAATAAADGHPAGGRGRRQRQVRRRAARRPASRAPAR